MDHFSDVLRACGGVISGSVALHYFLYDDTWSAGDLDIYLPDRMFDTFVAVVDNDPKIGFQLLPNSDQPQRRSSTPGFRGIRDIYRFRTKTNLHVDVIRSSMNSPITPIHAFWSTLVMNFLTPDGCACGFPRGTLQRQGIIRGILRTDNDHAAVAKYEGRGFHLSGGPWSRSLSDPATWDVDYFGDTDALILTFRLRLDEHVPPLPVIHSKRGWRIKHPYPRVSVRRSSYIRSLVLTQIPQAVWRQLRGAVYGDLQPAV